jgi:hypothetical protein
MVPREGAINCFSVYKMRTLTWESDNLKLPSNYKILSVTDTIVIGIDML